MIFNYFLLQGSNEEALVAVQSEGLAYTVISLFVSLLAISRFTLSRTLLKYHTP